MGLGVLVFSTVSVHILWLCILVLVTVSIQYWGKECWCLVQLVYNPRVRYACVENNECTTLVYGMLVFSTVTVQS